MFCSSLFIGLKKKNNNKLLQGTSRRLIVAGVLINPDLFLKHVLFQAHCEMNSVFLRLVLACCCLKWWLRWCLFPLVIHGGPLEEQEPSGARVGGAVLLPGRAQRLQRGPKRAELQEEPLWRRGRMWVHSDVCSVLFCFFFCYENVPTVYKAEWCTAGHVSPSEMYLGTDAPERHIKPVWVNMPKQH